MADATASRVKLTVDGEYEIDAIMGDVDTRSTVVVPEPAVLVAVIVNVVAEKSAAGVPVMAPVEVEKDKPVGSDGLMLQEAASPPVLAGESVRIAALVAS